jgi:CheY-like chemotaxis protein
MTIPKKKILVIDDSSTNVILLETIFSMKGYVIQTAISAKEAFSIIKRGMPAIILLDLNMPEISGFDFLEQIKKNEDTRSIPVLIVSAIVDNSSYEKAISLGAVGYINKPVDIPALLNKVSEILHEN